ncbi:hypothetical protein [Carboxylicivirga sp. N1Y90]|uniref:hypothetical protein n=1 Tax=Carboxylicivirga fragile TaxID=3417571 RepID=UPI003D345A7A|nr:hypothetical protein [Marinilabiliaceae bacterium N1Y90]
MARQASYNVKVNDTLEKTPLEEGDDIADLIIEIKKQEKINSPGGILAQMQDRNPNLRLLIDKFDLEITA